MTTGSLVRVCPQCREPVVWTFEFSGCEYHCPFCGACYPMLRIGDGIPATPELVARVSLAEALYEAMSAARREAGTEGVRPTGPTDSDLVAEALRTMPLHLATATCDGCGALGPYRRGSGACKPAHWYQTGSGDGLTVVCSRACIETVEQRTGRKRGVLPW